MRTAMALLLFCSVVHADDVVLRDGRRYPGESKRSGKSLRITGPKRVIDVLAESVGDPVPRPVRQEPWRKPVADMDPALRARADTLLRALIAARDVPDEVERLLGDVGALKIPYATWEALVRSGAGAPLEEDPFAVKGVQVTPHGRYMLRVPKGYTHKASAGLVVALHGQGDGLRGMLACWGRFADAEGLLVASVEYAVTGKEGYHHSWAEQRTVLSTIDDVSRRFHVDPDRVWVTGHSMGGHAAWDVALSHPDRFAGVVPLISSAFAFDAHYRRNAAHLPVYCIQGETDVWTERCRKHTKQMLGWGHDVTYVEYIGRGHEGFYEELPWVGQWMKARPRQPYPKRFALRAGRETDLRRYWVRLDELRIDLLELAPTAKVRKQNVAVVEARVQSRNTLRIDCKQASAITVFLSDRLVDLDAVVRVRFNRKVRFKGKVKRSIEGMLRDFLERGDRRMLFAASLRLED